MYDALIAVALLWVLKVVSEGKMVMASEVADVISFAKAHKSTHPKIVKRLLSNAIDEAVKRRHVD